ncbi:MAG: hypothetical protein EBU46_10035 [Nitrosomonadaceae bacterium]|nr:hypothetical protein [Nitrosomonadaceae bacterium]
MLTVTTPPATEPVTLAEMKLHSRIDGLEDDDLVNGLITAARMHLEQAANMKLITQTLTLSIDDFPASGILYLDGPVQSVTSIEYYDLDGNLQTWDSELYQVDTTANPARIMPAYDETWPDYLDDYNSIVVTYVAGYGDATAVPAILKQAIKMLVGHWYANRETTSEVQSYEVPYAVDQIVKMFSRGIVN